MKLQSEMSPYVFQRCHFVVKEILRVTKACDALDAGNIEELGRLMFETHDGLSSEYEVSCEELDFLVALAKDEKCIVGSRLMGGGFGGCTINLIQEGNEDEIKQKFSKLYYDKFGIELKNYHVKISNGTTLYKPN